MYKVINSVVVARGKAKEAKAYLEKLKNLFEKYGVTRRVWGVDAQKIDQMFMEWEEFESRAEFEAARDKIFADKEWEDLQKEAAKSGIFVEGSLERFPMTEIM